MIDIAELERTENALQLEFCTVFPRLNKLTVWAMEIFANEELVKAFLRGLLSDERVHGVPLDVLPPEIELSLETKRQSVEETAEMVAFCTEMQCDTERCSVSVLEAQRTQYGGANFR